MRLVILKSSESARRAWETRRYGGSHTTLSTERSEYYKEREKLDKEVFLNELPKFREELNIKKFYTKFPKVSSQIEEKFRTITESYRSGGLDDLGAKPEEVREKMQVVKDEIKSWGDKLQFNGRGRLSIKVGTIPKRGRHKTYGMYYPGIQVLEVDQRYKNSIAHEYAHFIFDDNGWEDSYKDSLVHGNFDEAYEFGFTNFLEKFSQDMEFVPSDISSAGTAATIKNQGKALIELFAQLKDFYKLPDVMEKFKKSQDPPIIWASTEALSDKQKLTRERIERTFARGVYKRVQNRMKYLFRPTEIFARAVGSYVSEDFISNPVEKDDRYKAIVKAWGDKYLKTGIVKSYVILEKAQIQIKPSFRHTASGKIVPVKGFTVERETFEHAVLADEFFKSLKEIEGSDWQFEPGEVFDMGDKINVEVRLWDRSKNITELEPYRAKGTSLTRYKKMSGYIGRFELNFLKNGKDVYLSSLFLKDEWQGKGVGNDLMKRAIDFGISKGFKSFELFANGDVGTYAWAIQGWDFVKKTEKQDLLGDFCKWLKKKYNVEKNPLDFPHAWNIAAFRIGDEKVGKKFMTGDGHNDFWEGALNVGSKGYKLFKEYHRLRLLRKMS
jgi:GNAT superfamily N-acetyltransferase